MSKKKWYLVKPKTKLTMLNNNLPLTGFEASIEKFTQLCSHLEPQWDVYQLESHVQKQGSEVLRQIIQDQLNKVSQRAQAQTPAAKRLHKRQLQTLFGKVCVKRPALSQYGQSSQHPLDSELNLPTSSYSFLLQKTICHKVADLSYDSASEQLLPLYPGHIPKRQALECVEGAMVDFEAFYAQSLAPELKSEEYLVMSFDGKGVNMRFEGLTAQTQNKARSQKLEKRLSRGEKSNRKRLATVAAVYTTQANKRTAAQMLNPLLKDPEYQPSKAENKRVWASLTHSMETVIEQAFDEASKREPHQAKPWVVLVDGNPAQILAVKRVAEKRQKKVVIVMDLVHVLEYLWQAAHSLYDVAEKRQSWVTVQLKGLMQGKLSRVVAQMKRLATMAKLEQRKGVDDCARYLMNHKQYLCYDRFLQKGYPLATGVIEGACRYLVKDRLEKTGARWSLLGAEAVLKLRALVCHGDLDDYWDFHHHQAWIRNYGQKGGTHCLYASKSTA